MNVTEATVFAAIDLAVKAHDGQFRQDGVTPYIAHVRRVANRMLFDDLVGRCVAWLHDVVEDTHVTLQGLGHHFPPEIVEPVRFLTKVKGQPYMDYLDAIKYTDTSDVARRVKIADMLDNLSDNPTQRQIRKYAKGLVHLTTKDW